MADSKAQFDAIVAAARADPRSLRPLFDGDRPLIKPLSLFYIIACAGHDPVEVIKQLLGISGEAAIAWWSLSDGGDRCRDMRSVEAGVADRCPQIRGEFLDKPWTSLPLITGRTIIARFEPQAWPAGVSPLLFSTLVNVAMQIERRADPMFHAMVADIALHAKASRLPNLRNFSVNVAAPIPGYEIHAPPITSFGYNVMGGPPDAATVICDPDALPKHLLVSYATVRGLERGYTGSILVLNCVRAAIGDIDAGQVMIRDVKSGELGHTVRVTAHVIGQFIAPLDRIEFTEETRTVIIGYDVDWAPESRRLPTFKVFRTPGPDDEERAAADGVYDIRKYDADDPMDFVSDQAIFMKQVPVMTDRARVRSLTVLLDIIPNGVEFGQHYEHLSEKMRALDPERTGPLTVYLSRNSVSSIGIMDPDWRARFEAVRDLCLGSPAVTSLIVTD